jgi:hypothetical protein
MYIDIVCGVENSTTSKHEVLFVFWLFLYVSLYVLVSFYKNPYKIVKSSLTHTNLHIEMSKIPTKLQI